MRAASHDDRRPALLALTGVRGFAAYGAVAWHASQFLDRLYPGIDHGYMGVDLFFLLSGFILCYVHGAEMSHPTMLRPMWRWHGRFLALRLGRIWPAYIVALLFVVLPQAVRENWLAHPLQSEPVKFAAHLLMLQNWGIVDPNHFNWPAWSVSAEWFAYLIFPLFLAGFGRLRAAIAAPLVPVLLALLALAFALGGIHGLNIIGPYGLLRAVVEFAAGVLLWRVFVDPAWARWRWDWIGVLAVVLLVVGTLVLPATAPTDFLLLLLLPPLLLSLAYGRGPVAALCASRPMLLLGEASYSIYLVHWGCMWRLDTLARDHGAAWPSWMSAGWTLFAATLIVSTMAGIALHFIVERPCRRWVRHRLGYA